MIVMPSNVTGFWCGYLAKKYEGKKVGLGHLFSPGGQLKRGPVMRYALDNGAFPLWQKRKPFDVAAWRELLDWAEFAEPKPMWALVPDSVGDRDETLRMWDRHAESVRARGFKLAFAAQDGMTFGDVPAEAAVVFIGGSDEFKAAALYPWCARFRCHVGRVTALDHLFRVFDAGAVSCDATGHFRTDEQRKNLDYFLERANAGQRSLNLDSSAGVTVPGLESCETGAQVLVGGRK